jgi:hypothetical protein
MHVGVWIVNRQGVAIPTSETVDLILFDMDLKLSINLIRTIEIGFNQMPETIFHNM